MTTVRRATPDDARAIAEVSIETWRAIYAGVMSQSALDALDVDEREIMWRSIISHPDVRVFVAERDGTIVGYVSVGACREEPGVGELFAIYVRPHAWSTGAGLALMEAGVAALRERFDEAVLWVAEENPRARRFYERYGWRTDGGTQLAGVEPGTEVPEVRYRLSGLQRR